MFYLSVVAPSPLSTPPLEASGDPIGENVPEKGREGKGPPHSLWGVFMSQSEEGQQPKQPDHREYRPLTSLTPLADNTLLSRLTESGTEENVLPGNRLSSADMVAHSRAHPTEITVSAKRLKSTHNPGIRANTEEVSLNDRSPTRKSSLSEQIKCWRANQFRDRQLVPSDPSTGFTDDFDDPPSRVGNSQSADSVSIGMSPDSQLSFHGLSYAKQSSPTGQFRGALLI